MTDAGIVELAEQLENAILRGGDRPDDKPFIRAIEEGDDLLRRLASTGSAARSVRLVWTLTHEELRVLALAAVVGETFRSAARSIAALDSVGPLN